MYKRNVTAAANYTAQPARLTENGNLDHPAVIIRNGNSIAAVMPIPDALRLANLIADAVEAHSKTN